MDLVFEKKWKEFEKALQTLEAAVKGIEADVFHRDASVIRFLYTSELFWKSLKHYIFERKGVNCLYARDVFRELQNMGVLSAEEVEIFISMVNDRNFCVHAYQENVIKKIAGKIPRYAGLMREVFGRLMAKS